MHYRRNERTGTTDDPVDDVVGRFWAHVEKTPTCWLWHSEKRYGLFYTNSQQWGAHRFSWTLANGPIPDGLWVLHHCDNPPCVRPDHLFVGTGVDNRRDCVAKGRASSGEQHWTNTHPEKRATGDRNGLRLHPARAPMGERNAGSVVTADVVMEIRRLHEDEGISRRDLEQRFGLSKSQIGKIVTRASWRHI